MELTLPPLARPAGATVVAPNNRVRALIDDRVYPPAERGPGALDPELPFALAGLPAALEARLPFAARAQAETSRRGLYDVVDESFRVIRGWHAEYASFLQDVFTCNTEVRAAWANDRRRYDMMQELLAEWTDRFPKFVFQQPAVITADSHRQPEFVLRTALQDCLRQCAHRLVRQFALGLDYLVQLEQVGLIEWTCGDACRFHFFRNVVAEEPGATREATRDEVTDRGAVRERRRTTRTERDYVRTRRHARHTHEVVCAKNYTVPAAERHVPMPDRARTLLARVPADLRPFLRVVTGQEVRRLVIERDLATETLTEAEEAVTVTEEVLYRPDPAVVIGHYVLTGWGDDELHPTHPAAEHPRTEDRW